MRDSVGATGRSATRESLRKAGLDALSYENSPVFLTIGSHTVAVVAVSAVPGRDGARVEIPSTGLRQKLRLARNLAELVVVFVHWGSELLEWPDVHQRAASRWFIQNGTDLIVGHHPHVVQTPECVLGRPVYFSLGNHLFDQKYPATKNGLIADCRIRDGVMQCGGIATQTPPGSAMPQPAAMPDQKTADSLRVCPVKLAPLATVSGFSLRGRVEDTENGKSEYLIEGTRVRSRTWQSTALPLVSAEVGKLAGGDGPEYLFTLEQHYSPIDDEEGVRPYVYEVRPTGLVARWRGSALAWPLLDAAILPGGDGTVCALHRRDSFVVLQPGAAGVRTAAYRWNGFGFSGVDDANVLERCQALFGTGR